MKTPEPHQPPHGWAWLKKSNPKLYAHWRDFCLNALDLYDWGFVVLPELRRHPDDFIERKNTYQVLDPWMDCATTKQQRRWLRKPIALTLKRMEAASRGDTLYVCSSPRLWGRKDRLSRWPGTGILVLDIDDKKGTAGDAKETFEFLNELLVSSLDSAAGAKLFGQVSTHGKGYHGYMHVSYDDVPAFRQVAADLEKAVESISASHGFRSKPEIKGEPGNIGPDGKYAPRSGGIIKFPILQGEADIHAFLFQTPLFTTAELREIVAKITTSESHDTHTSGIEERQGEGDQGHTNSQPSALHDTYTSGVQGKGGTGRLPANSDAWKRMQTACFRFTEVYHRLPTVSELLDFYLEAYQTHPATSHRKRRAKDAIHYRSMTFDPLAAKGGFAFYKDALLAAVKEFATDRTSKYSGRINDEDLAIALYTVQQNSYHIADDPRHQWSCPNAAFAGMFNKLQHEGVTGRGGQNRNKLVALKTILHRAALVECFDSRYVHGTHWGVGKKWTIGPSHWMYPDWCRWAEGVTVKKVSDLKAKPLPPCGRLWSFAEICELEKSIAK